MISNTKFMISNAKIIILSGAWRKGMQAFQFGSRATEPLLSNTMLALQMELGLGAYKGRPWEPGDPEGEEPRHVADGAYECVVACPANRKPDRNSDGGFYPVGTPTREDAVAGGWLRDTGGSEPVSYLEKIDVACRAIGRQAEWAGREDWIAKGGRSNGDLQDQAYAVWKVVEEMEEQEMVMEEEEDMSHLKDPAAAGAGINAARKRLNAAGKAVVSTQRMKMIARPKRPPRKLAAPMMELPDRVKFAAYYDIIARPIDMGIILKRIKDSKYPTCLAFRNDMQQLFFNNRITAGRGTTEWDDLNQLEDVACGMLAKMTNRLPYTDEQWPKWNTIPPELVVKSAEDGTICSVLYDLDDTIAQVKAKCEANGKQKLNCEGRRMMHKGEVLGDDDVISEKAIPVGAQLRLEAYLMVEWGDMEDLEAENLSAAWKAVGEEVAMEAREEGSAMIRYVAQETMDHVLSRLAKEPPMKEGGDYKDPIPAIDKLQLFLVDVDAPLELDLTLQKAGILPGGTLRLIAEVPPEAEPEPDAVEAAIKIQALQRGWRMRRAMAFVRDYDCKNIDQACWKAVIRDDARMLALLVAHGGNRDAHNAAGLTMDELARERGRRKVLAFLETGDLDFNPAAFDAAEKIRLEEQAAAAKVEELPEGQMKVVMVELKKDDEMDATIHLDEEEALMQQQAMFAAQQEQERLRQEELMEKLQDPRVREAVSLEALHSRLTEHRRIMQAHVSGGWMGDSTLMEESSLPNVSQPGAEVSANYTEWTRGKRRPRKQRPLKRRHTGTLAALVAEPLFLMQAEQPGMRGAMIDPTRGNLAMHQAMHEAQTCVPPPRPARALTEPIQNMRGLERLWVEDQTSVHEALEKLERSGGFA